MVRLSKLFNAFGMSMVMTMAACKQTLNMKALILSTSQIESDTVTLHLKSYGIPYDLFEFSPASMLTGNLTLYNDKVEPLYNLVIINGGDLVFEVNNTWTSALTTEQWAYLNEYEAANGVRRVVISEDAAAINTDIELYEADNWGETKDDQALLVDTSDEVKAIFNDARIKITAPLNVNGIFHTRVKIVDTATTKPFLYYSDNGQQGPVAATISKYPDGREKMSFYFALGSWSQSSIIINHLWLTWGTRSLFNGFRRVYFTPHIDDVFLGTELVDPKNNNMEGEEVFRTTPFDFQKIAQFQKDVLDIMPEGSFYRVELAFNGNGILISGDYDNSIQIDAERYVDLEFVMEPGTGEKRWPKENYQFTSANLAAFEKDDLYKYFYHNETAQKEFFWSSHTFSHENLDNVSRTDVDNEIRLNIELAERLGLTDKEYWSGGAIITPQISGLHSKDALEIFMKYGITSATGDLSRPAICNVVNPYLPFYTTMESSNLVGFPVIPRTPTEVYYFCSTKEEDTWMYNQIYHDYFGKDSTFDEILKRESERTLLLMTKLRHEAHQFHQANLRYYKKEGNYGESLLEDWTRSVVNLYTKYVDWPLISVKIDKQAETFVERAKLEACGHETKLIIENNKVTGVSVTATAGDCTVPITVPGKVKSSSLPSDATLEQIGKDPLTVWIPLKKGETKSFDLEVAIDWISTPTIVEPTTTTTVVEPTTTTTVVEPTTTIVVEPTISTIVVEPTISTIVVEPTISTIVVEPTISTIVVEPTISTIVVEPTVSTIVVEPTISTIVVEPTTTTTVVEPTTTTTTVVVEPTTTIVVEPTISTIVVEPTISTIVVEPTISTIVVEPTTSTIVVEPTTSTTTIKPTTTIRSTTTRTRTTTSRTTTTRSTTTRTRTTTSRTTTTRSTTTRTRTTTSRTRSTTTRTRTTTSRTRSTTTRTRTTTSRTTTTRTRTTRTRTTTTRSRTTTTRTRTTTTRTRTTTTRTRTTTTRSRTTTTRTRTTTTRSRTTTRTRTTTTRTPTATSNPQCRKGYERCGDFLFGPSCCEQGYSCKRLILTYACLPN